MIIVAFGHRKRVGKNLAAKLLKENINFFNMSLRVDLHSFAYKLKDVAYQLFSWDGMKTAEYYEEHEEEKYTVLPTVGKTVRQIWIDLGTPAVREKVYDKTWIYNALGPRPHTDVLIMTDCRFQNEADAVKTKGGKVIKIERPNEPISSDVADDALIGWTGWDSVIVNDGLKSQLAEKLMPLAEEINRRVANQKI